MKKEAHLNNQLKLKFDSTNQNSKPNPKSSENESFGKQVFFNPRQDIYNKIINRKME